MHLRYFGSYLCVAAAVWSAPSQAQTAQEVVVGYADLAAAKYADALTTAQTLRDATQDLIDNPSPVTHAAAKSAWRLARKHYQQTEVFRFGNPRVDAWEGRVNAWPVDEGLIDYVDLGSYSADALENRFFQANVIGQTTIDLGGYSLDIGTITPALLRNLHEIDGIETNVATGYHAIEFLLWGQDLNGSGPGAGARPFTDFVRGADCTGGACDRRAQYLSAAAQLLVDDVSEMADAWKPEGAARRDLTKQPEPAALAAILIGMGSLSYGELAGERMQLGLMLNDPEEEHDCFADTTHEAHYYNAMGVQNVYRGQYLRLDGTQLQVPALETLTAAKAPALNTDILTALRHTMQAMGAMRARANNGIEAYDQMISLGNTEGNAVVQAAIDALVAQTVQLEALGTKLTVDDMEFMGSASLDNASAVFQ